MKFLHHHFLNTIMAPNRLFITEITGNFNRIKWQVIKFSLWSKEREKKLKNATKWCHWGHTALCWWAQPPAASVPYPADNIWNSEQATIADHRPGIRKATPALWRSHGCWGICQSARFLSKPLATHHSKNMPGKKHNSCRIHYNQVELLQMCGLAFNQYILEYILQKQSSWRNCKRILQKFDAYLFKCDHQIFYNPVASKNMRFGSKCQKRFCSFRCVLKHKADQKDGSYCGPVAFLCCMGFFLSSISGSFFTPDVFHLWRHT